MDIDYRVVFPDGSFHQDRHFCFARLSGYQESTIGRHWDTPIAIQYPVANGVFLTSAQTSNQRIAAVYPYLDYLVRKFADTVHQKSVEEIKKTGIISVRCSSHFTRVMIPLMYARSVLEEKNFVQRFINWVSLYRSAYGLDLYEEIRLQHLDILFLMSAFVGVHVDTGRVDRFYFGNANHVIFSNPVHITDENIKRYLAYDYPATPVFTESSKFNGNMNRTITGSATWINNAELADPTINLFANIMELRSSVVNRKLLTSSVAFLEYVFDTLLKAGLIDEDPRTRTT